MAPDVGVGVQAAPSSGALLPIFVLSLLIPIAFEIAGIRLSPSRLLMLILIVPFGARVLSGKVGRRTTVDMLFLMHGIWIFVALIVAHGTSRIPFAGITAVEIIGGYFVGRVLVRNVADYRRLFRLLLIAILCLLPFALVEAVTGKLVIPDLLRPVFITPYRGDSAYGRMGLERVYGVFEHPILWGLFCSLTLSNFVMLARGNIPKMALGSGLAFFATMLSLSSAPLLACGMQILLLGWNFVMRGRWKLLITLSVIAYVVVDSLSNRTPVTILIETLTFNPGTGYTRIAIFDAGWAAVKGSPIFGIGFNDWPRPFWVTSSVDNFWLLTAMRYGLVGCGFLIAAFLAHLVSAGRAAITDPELKMVRVGHSIAVFGTAFTMTTVHVWGPVSVMVMFYLGAGTWLYTEAPKVGAPDGEGEGDTAEAPAPAGPGRASPYSRFTPRRRQP